MKIYSKIKKDKILCIINKKNDITKKRIDLCEENDFLQVSCKKLDKKDKFLPHKHLEQERITNNTHESWIVIEGLIKVKIYDIDDKKIHEEFINPGDCFVSISCGHSLEVIDNNTIMYEFKNGPYNGVEKDKVIIKDIKD